MKRMRMLAIVLSVFLTTLFSVNLASAECLEIVKSGPETAAPGDEITYTIIVTNNCATDLTSVKIEDGAWSEYVGDLASGDSYTAYRKYVVTEDCNTKIVNEASVTGCDGVNWLVATATWTVDVICEAKCETDLIAGQDWKNPVGVVTINEMGGYLIVKFETTDDWNLEETHLYVGTEMPKKAAPGQFPYSNQSGEYKVPLMGVGYGTTLYIAAHAVVSPEEGPWETAWADKYGIPFGKGKNWAMVIEYVVGLGCVEQP